MEGGGRRFKRGWREGSGAADPRLAARRCCGTPGDPVCWVKASTCQSCPSPFLPLPAPAGRAAKPCHLRAPAAAGLPLGGAATSAHPLAAPSLEGPAPALCRRDSARRDGGRSRRRNFCHCSRAIASESSCDSRRRALPPLRRRPAWGAGSCRGRRRCCSCAGSAAAALHLPHLLRPCGDTYGRHLRRRRKCRHTCPALPQQQHRQRRQRRQRCGRLLPARRRRQGPRFSALHLCVRPPAWPAGTPAEGQRRCENTTPHLRNAADVFPSQYSAAGDCDDCDCDLAALTLRSHGQTARST